MELTIAMSDERDAQELDLLYLWLTDSPDMEPGVEVKRGTDGQRPDVMGVDADTITAVVSTGASVVSAITSILAVVLTWRSTRPKDISAVSVRSGSGLEPVEISDTTSQSSEELARLLVASAEPDIDKS